MVIRKEDVPDAVVSALRDRVPKDAAETIAEGNPVAVEFVPVKDASGDVQSIDPVWKTV